MSDQFSALENQARQARMAQSFVDQATALMSSPADRVVFTCANPPYAGMFAFDLPRSVWGPVLQAQINDAAGTVATASGAASAVKVG